MGKYEMEFFMEECKEYQDEYVIVGGKHVLKKVKGGSSGSSNIWDKCILI